ncbi:MAG: M23 family metallopeptidase [Hyphomicrobiaceae bacterium]|nr:M23 family metallopeptidase [Hyphomicrobiaceae bacterium]
MLDTRRHAPVGRTRATRLASRTQGLPHVYRGRARRAVPDIYDHGEPRRGGRFRWLLSTCLAAAVGAVAIGVVLFGSLDGVDTSEGVIPALQKFREARLPQPAVAPRSSDGLSWTAPKSDRLQVTAGVMAAKHIIHEQVQVRRDNRPFIQIRPYLRIVARLSEVPPAEADVVPPFNPFKLYAAPAQTDADAEGAASEARSDVAIKVLELLGGILPGEDGQELDTQEVAELVARAQEAEAEGAAMRPSLQPEDSGAPANSQAEAAPDAESRSAPAANTTVLLKSVADADDADDLEQSEVRVIRVARGDSLDRILQRLGSEPWQIRAMLEAAKPSFPENALAPGQEVHVTLVPSLSKPDKVDPVRLSVFTEAHEHKVTVHRNAAGEFVVSSTPYDPRSARAALGDSDKAHTASLYSSLYHSALLEGVPPDSILHILRIHAYETDFRRRVRHGDAVDFFFDVKEDAGPDSAPGELLYTAITSGGETQRFWRFRTPDGMVDYYDELGSNSKKFLMRRPVRGEAVRLTSGYGTRVHPVFNVPKMHTGVDWASPVGTPILAAGNGLIEEAQRKGQYGNYVRIRHANGYQTTYAHMSRHGAGIREGVKVKQGQVIGYVGCTGLCSGPHLHYEVLVNSRFVDPLKIQVPRERQLAGRQLAEYQKERARIDELMRRAPVMTASR